jgi:hypothetical protein
MTLRRQMSQAERTLFGNNDLPTISLWAKKPLRFGAAYSSQLKRSCYISVYLNANVTVILSNPSGTSVDALRVATLSGKGFRPKAKRVVLACGSMENARLLLVPREVQGHGIGNRDDVVGRYFMDHPRAVFGKVKLYGRYKLPVLLGLPLEKPAGLYSPTSHETHKHIPSLLCSPLGHDGVVQSILPRHSARLN